MKKKKEPKEPNPVFTECVRIWLKEIHPGWTFTAMHGKKIKSLITKIINWGKVRGFEMNDTQVINSFAKIMQWIKNDPYYSGEEIHVIDSHANKIFTKIEQGKTNSNVTYQAQPSSSRLFGKFG